LVPLGINLCTGVVPGDSVVGPVRHSEVREAQVSVRDDQGAGGSNACVNVERGCLSGASGHRPAPGTRANQIRTRPRTSYRPAVRGRSGPATCRHVRPTERNDRATPRGAASRATCTSALCESTCSLLARTSPPSCPEGGTTRVRAARHPHPGLQLPTPARVEPSRLGLRSSLES
jgi:hypothetical protein